MARDGHLPLRNQGYLPWDTSEGLLVQCFMIASTGKSIHYATLLFLHRIIDRRNGKGAAWSSETRCTPLF